MKFKIGNIEIANQVCIAPMAGISNSAFRRIVKEMGAGLIYAEMVSDKAVMYNSKKTIDLLYMTDEERPITQQIFGSDVESFIKAAKIIYEKTKPDIIDINMGCPVPKIAQKSQAGAALLKDIKKVGEIVKAVVEAVPIPVTVKIRSGWDFENINAIEIAKICEKNGAKAIAVHPRTRSQGYSGLANWDIIKKVKENVTIPVIGNGDIKSIEDAKRMLEETGCDAIMLGRAVLGNPFIVRDTVAFLENNKLLVPASKEEKIEMCLKHLDYLIDLKGEKRAQKEIRSHIGWYLKGMENASVVKEQIFKETEIEKIKALLIAYKGLKKGENNI